MKILTTEEMQAIDRRAIDELGVPGLVLMENAAIGVVDAIAESFPAAESVGVFCGPGNNGGDGLAIARHLSIRGYRVGVVVVTSGRPLTGDARIQEEICTRQGLTIRHDVQDEDAARLIEAVGASDLWIDALFGTGLRRPLEGRLADLAKRLSDGETPVVAVDLPSGLDAGREVPPGPCVEADLTVTFAAPKIALVLPPSCEAAGDVVVADLGVPTWLVEEGGGEVHLLDPQWLSSALPERATAGHKGDFGHLLVVAGSPGKSGAAVLAASAGVLGGAGLVTAAVPDPIVEAVDCGSIESMTRGLPSQSSGELAARARDRIAEIAQEMDAVALGPGLGQSPEAADCIRETVLGLPLPMVLDADGINSFSGRAGELMRRSAPTVVTPHPGEMARLLQVDISSLLQDRLAAVRAAATSTGAVVVLKGYRSLIASPEGRVWVNPTGNSGMASGGSGDVLTGLIGAFLAQGVSATGAALLAVYLHGLAGDLARDRVGDFSLRASNLLELLPPAFAQLRQA